MLAVYLEEQIVFTGCIHVHASNSHTFSMCKYGYHQSLVIWKC